MKDVLITALLAALFLWWLYLLVKPREPIKIVERKCKKDPTKDCPYVAYLTDRGGLRSEGHTRCCAVIDNIKKMNDAFCKMEPGKVYGDIIITEDFKRQSIRAKQKLDKIDTKGPLQ